MSRPIVCPTPCADSPLTTQTVPVPVALLPCASYARATVEAAVARVMEGLLSPGPLDTAPPMPPLVQDDFRGGAQDDVQDDVQGDTRGTSQAICAAPEVPHQDPSSILVGRGAPLSRGAWVLVKPNLLRAGELCCTHAEVTRAVCLHLLEHGCRVTVADSPGFGTARSVAAAIGLTDALRPLGLTVQSLNDAQPVPLGSGGHWGVARLALECDHVLSVPKVKAHCQMRATLAVKNLFGCVCGLRKAVAHTRQGKDRDIFTHALLDLWRALPPVSAVVDGVTAMHITGPSGGQPFALGCVGASMSAVALDTALYTLLHARLENMPLWAAAQRASLVGARREDLSFPLSAPEDFDARLFVLPHELIDVSFEPHRLFISLCRRVWTALRA